MSDVCLIQTQLGNISLFGGVGGMEGGGRRGADLPEPGELEPVVVRSHDL